MRRSASPCKGHQSPYHASELLPSAEASLGTGPLESCSWPTPATCIFLDFRWGQHSPISASAVFRLPRSSLRVSASDRWTSGAPPAEMGAAAAYIRPTMETGVWDRVASPSQPQPTSRASSTKVTPSFSATVWNSRRRFIPSMPRRRRKDYTSACGASQFGQGLRRIVVRANSRKEDNFVR